MGVPAVHRLEMPNPFFEGAMNAYAIAGDFVTLIDVGSRTPGAMDVLASHLAAVGLRLEDVRQVILTHKHPDHFGLTRQLQEALKVRVYIHEADRDFVAHYPDFGPVHVRMVLGCMERWGVPGDRIEPLEQMIRFAFDVADPVLEPAALEEGEQIDCGGLTLEVLNVPGHTEGCICLRGGPYLFTGDHVLPGTTPNVGGDELGRVALLDRFLQSLERVATMADQWEGPLRPAFPGHGDPIEDVAARARRIVRHHLDRDEKLLEKMVDGQPRTVWEITTALFGPLDGYHVVLGAGEVYAHLERLARQGRIAERNDRFSIPSG